MSVKVRVKLNQKEVRAQLLKSSAVAGLCMSIANSRAKQAGAGYDVRVVNYPERTGAVIYPRSAAARRDNYQNNTLEKLRGGKDND